MRNTYSLFFFIMALIFSFLSGANGQIFTYSGSPVSIPDASCPTETLVPITVTGIGPIGGGILFSTVCLDMTHTFDGDAEFWLRSPAGTTVELSTDNGGAGDNFVNTCFNMEGANGPITAGTAPFTGTYIPEGNLNLFNDFQNADGVWQLVLCDDAGGDLGTVTSWSIEFVIPPDNDVGVSAIISPGSTCGLTATEQITIVIENFGLLTQTTIPVSYTVGANPTVMETYAGSIAPGMTDTYTFSATSDFTALGPYNISATTALGTDTEAGNDASMVTIQHYPLINTFPLVEDFESWTLCGNTSQACTFSCAAAVANGFLQDDMDGADWRVDNGSTPSGGTGPNGDHNPGTTTGKYVFTEASNCFNTTFNLISPCMDVSVLSNPFVDFYWHMFGDNYGTLNFQITTDGGITWNTIWSNTGQFQTSTDVNTPEGAWQLQEVSLGAPGTIVQVRWQGITGSGFESDMALDDIRIYDRPDVDVAVLSVNSPESNCDLSDMETVEITLSNLSAMDVTSIPIEVQVNGGGFVSAGSYSGSIPAGGTDIYSFPLDLSAYGVYTIDVQAIFPMDGDPSNDIASTTVENIQPINVFPWTEDFESFTFCGNLSNPCNFDCQAAVANNWEQDDMDGDDWRVDSGTTPSAGTGPNQDHNPGTAAGKYLFTESSGCSDVTSNLISPCFDVSGLGNPFVDFYWHMFGDNMGTMNLQISTDGGSSWNTLWTNTGQFQTSQNTQIPEGAWALQEVSLANPGTVIKLRWQGITGNGFESDMAIDDVRLYDRPDIDVKAVSVSTPDNSCNLTDMETITVTIQNLSGSPVTDIPIEVQVNGGGFVSAGMFTGGPIPAGGTDTYSFNLDLSAFAVFMIDVKVLFPGDGDGSNDIASATVEHITPINSFPWVEDFETFTPCGNAFNPCPFDCENAVSNNWVQDQTDNDDWRIDFGSTPSGPGTTGPSQDHNPGTPTGLYLFTEASAGCDNLESRIISPCFDISALSNPYVEFYFHMHGSDQGSMSLSISNDDGNTWTNLWSASGELQTAATDPWALAAASISGFPGTIKLRWEGLTDVGFEGDMALDDIKIYDRPDYDVNVVDITEPATACGLSANTSVTVVLESLSITDTSQVPVAYSVNNGPAVMETFPGPISPGINETYTFSQGADLSAPGTYTIAAWTEFDADGDHSNDTTFITITSIPVIDTFPYNMGFEAGPGGWVSEGMNNTWEWGTPSATIINMAASGTSSWVTNLDGLYNNSENSFLVSPCFDFSAIPVDPTVRFAIWHETENGFDECWLDMSIDGGLTWSKVGLSGTGINWYNDNVNQWWENSSGGWMIAENILEGSAGESEVKFRFALSTDGSVAREGIGIDDFQIIPPLDFDAELAGPFGEYTRIPARQANVIMQARVENVGLNNLNGVSADFVILNDVGGQIYNSSGSVPVLPAGFGVTIFPADPFEPPYIGDYTLLISANNGQDEDLTNNIGNFPFTITESLFARDDNDFADNSSLGIGAGGGDNGQLGQNFELVEEDALTSVTFRLNAPPTGDVIRANIYSTNTNGSPNTLLASTFSHIITPGNNSGGVTLTLNVNGGPLILQPGTYYLGVIEPGNNITLATTENIFTPGSTWLRWDGNPNGANIWSNNEDFGFEVTYYIRANFETCGVLPFFLEGDVFNETLDGSDNGEIDLILNGGVPAYSFDWSNGATTQDLANLPDGSYSVLVTDLLGCTDSISFVVGQGCAGLNLITNVDDETVAGENDGIIDLTITMGINTAPFTYQWDNGATSQDLSGLAPGTYCVTVNDFYGCKGILCASVLPGCGPFGLETEVMPETIMGSNDGAINLSLSGGTPPYTYTWDNGATTQDIAGLVPGVYCVTVNDFYGCLDETCANVVLTSVNNISGLQQVGLYPNPTSGKAILSMDFNRTVDAWIDIINVLGQRIYTGKLDNIQSSRMDIDGTDFAPGMYYLRIRVDGEIAVLPLVISR